MSYLKKIVTYGKGVVLMFDTHILCFLSCMPGFSMALSIFIFRLQLKMISKGGWSSYYTSEIFFREQICEDSSFFDYISLIPALSLIIVGLSSYESKARNFLFGLLGLTFLMSLNLMLEDMFSILVLTQTLVMREAWLGKLCRGAAHFLMKLKNKPKTILLDPMIGQVMMQYTFMSHSNRGLASWIYSKALQTETSMTYDPWLRLGMFCKLEHIFFNKLIQYAKRVWGFTDSDDALIESAILQTEKFFRSLGVKTKLAEYDIEVKVDIEYLIAKLQEHQMIKLGEHQDISLEDAKQILLHCGE